MEDFRGWKSNKESKWAEIPQKRMGGKVSDRMFIGIFENLGRVSVAVTRVGFGESIEG